jgi:hypothetical protein
MISEVSPSERLYLLKGPCAGCMATVSATPSPVGGEFLVHVDGDPDTTLVRVPYLEINFLGILCNQRQVGCAHSR